MLLQRLASTNIGIHSPAGAVVASGDVYVIAHPQSDESILAHADHEFTYLSNGNDRFSILVEDEDSYTIMETVDWNGDPGDGWDVAGIQMEPKTIL